MFKMSIHYIHLYDFAKCIISVENNIYKDCHHRSSVSQTSSLSYPISSNFHLTLVSRPTLTCKNTRNRLFPWICGTLFSKLLFITVTRFTLSSN